MQGKIIVTTNWVDVNSLQATDINDKAITLGVAVGDFLKLYNAGGVAVWQGDAPTTQETAGSIYIDTDGIIGVTETVYVRSLYEDKEITVEVVKGA